MRIKYPTIARYRSKVEPQAALALIPLLADGRIETIHKYPDGFRWVQLLDQKALTHEGDLMGHCSGSSCPRLGAGTEAFSLRDSKNEPHATILSVDGTISEMAGKQNKAVVEKYRSYIDDFIENNYHKR